MALSTGTQLGSYEITALLGRGGMGEVWRARDAKLKRDVAIKILPDEFARDSDRVARFLREAEVLASLNHPNIAAIHHLDEADGSRFLVLELVEGDTLAERIERGPMPVKEALDIAKHICEALEAAHEKGIVHRDLKTANVKITPNGNVKVLDFGLAKAIEQAPATALSNSPTLMSMAATKAGVILGTAAYMSPEQAKGLPVDRRTDIFSLGVVLYEMLTGTQAFRGDTVGDILAAVILAEPDWTRLPPDVPPVIRKQLQRCLEKDVAKRRRDAGDLRIDIEDVLANPAAFELGILPAVGGTRKRERLAWTIAVGLGMALTVLSFLYFNRAEPPEPSEIRVDVTTPPTADAMSFAIAPDGRRLVFLASAEGKSQLWIRSLESITAQPLAGTDGATYPFWSPDSASVGFFADGKLKRIDIAGGAPQVLANAPAGRGGAWNRAGTILFSPVAGSARLFKVPATGGEPVAVTKLEAGQTNHKFPQFLPDDQHFIYFAQGKTGMGIYTGSLDGGSSRRLVSANAAAVFSPSGFLLFPRGGGLVAQAFDFKRQELSGNPFPVVEHAVFDAVTAAAGFSATSGIVAYRSGAGASRQLTWLDRSGKSAGLIGAIDDADLIDVDLSPDGKRVAVHRTINGNADLWLIDAARGVPMRFTFDAASDIQPVWSVDGSSIMFTSNRTGVYNLYRRLSGGAGADELLAESDQHKLPGDWSSDGRFLLFSSIDPETGYDLWVLPVSGDKKPFPFQKTSFDERDGQFSPDGKWIAYRSNESGRFEIYVQPFPGPGGKFQISNNGGAQPRWNKNGKEIFYVSLDSKMMVATVKLSQDGQLLETGTPAALFPVRIAGGPLPGAARQQYAVSPDGKRFLVNLEARESATSSITLIYNWHPQVTK